MPEFSRDQLEALGKKLDQLGDDFNDDDRALLITTFGLAARALGNTETPGAAKATELDIPRQIQDRRVTLADGLVSAFEPGGAGQFVEAADDATTISGGVTWTKM